MDRSARNYPLEDIDRETMFHPNTSIVDHLKKGPHIMAEANGVRVKDRQGRELIDCGAGLWCVNIGYGRREMGEAAKRAFENLAYHHIFGGTSNEPIIRLAERVLRPAPRDLLSGLDPSDEFRLHGDGREGGLGLFRRPEATRADLTLTDAEDRLPELAARRAPSPVEGDRGVHGMGLRQEGAALLAGPPTAPLLRRAVHLLLLPLLGGVPEQ